MSDQPTTLFIPEKYLTHREVISELYGHGWGIQIPADELGLFIRSGRIAVSILPDNFIAVVHETAVKETL